MCFQFIQSMTNLDLKLKCPKCNSDMESGLIIDSYGDVGNQYCQSKWAERLTKVLGIFQGNPVNEKQIITYRCIKYGFLESFAK